MSITEKLSTHRQELTVPMLNRSHNRVGQIPPEITSNIFYLYAHDETSSVLKRLFTVALVSKSWRDIALSAPQLWTSLTFTTYGHRWTFPREVAETWLQRSGALQVKVTLRWVNRVAVTSPEGIVSRYGRAAKVDQQFLDIIHLLKHSGRMRYFQLQVPLSTLPKLDFDLGSIQDFRLHLLNILPSPIDHDIPLTLRQITRIRIDTALTANNALEILQQCPLLVEWTSLTLRRWSLHPIAPGTHVQATHLSTFEVDSNDNMLREFIDALTLPSLQCLVIKLLSISYISGLLSQSPNLSHLSLHCDGALYQDVLSQFVANLYGLSQLRRLSLTFGADDAEDWAPQPSSTVILPFLSPKPGSPFLPHLTYFRYAASRLQSWSSIAAFYRYHSTDASMRPLCVVDFSDCVALSSEDVIDRGTLETFLTLPTNRLLFKFNLKLLAMSIEHYGLPMPGGYVLSYYTGLQESVLSVRLLRRQHVLFPLSPGVSFDGMLPGSDAEIDQDDSDVSGSAEVTA